MSTDPNAHDPDVSSPNSGEVDEPDKEKDPAEKDAKTETLEVDQSMCSRDLDLKYYHMY